MPDKGADQETLRAFHFDRVFRKFNLVSSAENAEILAALLGADDGSQGNAA